MNKQIAVQPTNQVVQDVSLTPSPVSSSSEGMDLDEAERCFYKKKASMMSGAKKDERQQLERVSSSGRYNEHKKSLLAPNRNDLDRPPARLNYYDSESNTFSEGFAGRIGSTTAATAAVKQVLPKDELSVAASELSGIIESKFDMIENVGHRTSTPNMSNRHNRQAMNVYSSSSEIRQIKRQINGESNRLYK